LDFFIGKFIAKYHLLGTPTPPPTAHVPLVIANDKYVLISSQVKDRQKKKRPPKGIRVDADGVVSLEDFDNPGSQDADNGPAEQQNGTAGNKKVHLISISNSNSHYPFLIFILD